MKATIKFKEYGRIRQRTIHVDINEPNYIVRELVRLDNRVTKSTYITTIKCGRKEYQ